MSQLLVFVLGTLTAYRLWRLVGLDTITEPMRMRLPGRVTHMLECPWCAGSWIAFATFAVAAWLVDVRAPVLQALAAAAVVGWLGRLDVHVTTREG